MKFRVLNSGPGEAAVNMTVDRSLIEMVTADPGQVVLRWYTWSPPGFSLGCGQKPEDVLNFDTEEGRRIGWTKRPTGGSVVFHGGDLSYSLTLPRERFSFTNDQLYRFVTGAWREGFARLGVEVEPPKNVPLFRDIPPELRRICLASASPGDLLIAGRKIGGSAQRRLRSVWHQDGFFLLRPLPMPAACLKSSQGLETAQANSTDLESCGFRFSEKTLRRSLTDALVRKLQELEADWEVEDDDAKGVYA